MKKKASKKKSLVIQYFIPRLICSLHLILSIFLLLFTKYTYNFFYIPLIGLGLIIFEIILCCLFKFRFQSTFIFLLIYSIFILSTIWFLEFYRINYLIWINNQQLSVEVFGITYYTPIQHTERFFLSNKYLWSQIQIQLYVFLIVIVKGLCEIHGQRLITVMQTWATVIDIVDFINLLNYSGLYSNSRMVYIILSVWSISCLQFTIHVSTIRKILIKLNYPRLGAMLSNSLISMITTDIPYLIIRLYEIFGVQNDDYTSYFLVVKNLVVISLQIADAWSNFIENRKKSLHITSV